VLTGEVEEVLLLDVTPLSLGIETAGGVFYRLIPRNTAIPARATEVFSTTIDNQPFVDVHVLQGEREMAADNKSLAHFELTGIPPAPRGVPKIEVSFDIDADGVLSVSARDHGTGRNTHITVSPTTGLSDLDIERLVSESAEMAEADLVRRALAEARNKGEGLLYSSEKAMEEFGALLPDEERDFLATELTECRTALEGDDLTLVQDAVARLEVSAQRIGEAIYAAADQSPGGGG
jgi:molecular chaperone DnaK